MGERNETIRESAACCQGGGCCGSAAHKVDQAASFETEAAPGHRAEYRIGGMDCPTCAATVEKSVANIAGIVNVQVHYGTGRMRVTASTLSALDAIPEVVRKAGHTAERIDGGEEAGGLHSRYGESAGQGESYLYLGISGALLLAGAAGEHAGWPGPAAMLLLAAAIVLGGWKTAKSAFYAVKNRSLDMNVLMTAAVAGAALIGQWLEGAAVVWLFALGNALQARSVNRTRRSIRSLMSLAPLEADVLVGSRTVRMRAEEVSAGDTIVVKPGMNIPLDGTVSAGFSSVNQAPITGESVPVEKRPGDDVYAGTVNGGGVLEISVTKRFEQSALARIIHSVEEAQERKAPAQTFVDRFAAVYTPIVFAIALLIMAVPPMAGFGAWTEWFYKGLELLVIACPCALVISTPVAVVSAIGSAAANGVLIKGGAFLETAGKVDAMAFDKTGTLTEGKPAVVHSAVFKGTERELAGLAFALEEKSTHPAAAALVEYAQRLAAAAPAAEDVRTVPGKGMQASIEGTVHYAGSLNWYRELGPELRPPQAEGLAERLQGEGHTLVLIWTQRELLGLYAIADPVREASARTLNALKAAGIRETVMLTGDSAGAASRIAAAAGVDRFEAELLPEHKTEAIRRLQAGGRTVAMVGDGINDAPALAEADLGIAMGGIGTDTAMETAGIVLMADHLERLPDTVRLSRRTMRIIRQNVWFSVLIKLAALALVFPGWLTLWIAVVSDTGAALVVIANSLRLVRFQTGKLHESGAEIF